MRATGMLLLMVGAAFAQTSEPVKTEADYTAEIEAAVAKLPVADAERPWKEHAYKGFVASIDKLTGPGAFDCGYYDVKDKRQTLAFQGDVRTCVNAAIASGNPFKYGFEHVAVDALHWQVIARAPSGELWVVDVFKGIGHGREQSNKVCAGVRFFSDIRTINEGCVEKAAGPLPKT